MTDPIIEEARRAGQAYIDSFHGDLKAVIADLQRRTAEARHAGHEVVSLPPRPNEARSEPPQKRRQGEELPVLKNPS